MEEVLLSLIESTCGLLMLSGLKKYSAEPLVPEPIALEFEMVVEKLKRHKSPGIDQIPTEVI